MATKRVVSLCESEHRGNDAPLKTEVAMERVKASNECDGHAFRTPHSRRMSLFKGKQAAKATKPVIDPTLQPWVEK